MHQGRRIAVRPPKRNQEPRYLSGRMSAGAVLRGYPGLLALMCCRSLVASSHAPWVRVGRRSLRGWGRVHLGSHATSPSRQSTMIRESPDYSVAVRPGERGLRKQLLHDIVTMLRVRCTCQQSIGSATVVPVVVPLLVIFYVYIDTARPPPRDPEQAAPDGVPVC